MNISKILNILIFLFNIIPRNFQLINDHPKDSSFIPEFFSRSYISPMTLQTILQNFQLSFLLLFAHSLSWIIPVCEIIQDKPPMIPPNITRIPIIFLAVP